MNHDPFDATFTYLTDDISVSQWRSIIGICQAYEDCLLDGQDLSVDDFASKFPEIPGQLLARELERVRLDVLEEATGNELPAPHDPAQRERYLILDEIRSGGMGQVFRAFDRTCGRLVALKRIRSELAMEPHVKRRFLAEVEMTAGLEHPGVIPIYDQSIDADGREFYVMRLIHGQAAGTLQQAINRFHAETLDSKPEVTDPLGVNSVETKLRPAKAWNSARRADFRKLIQSVLVVVETTAHAHGRGIAHRDLKPSNILVGPYGETLIADWGLAKRIHQNATQADPHDASKWSSHAQGVGTPGFRAPETQGEGASANLVAADIYSLGAILECVVVGLARRSGESADGKHGTTSPASILPLMAIAQKAMSSEVTLRYGDAESMREDLSNWLAGEPVSAYPESLAERVWKWPSRHRIAASAIASALIITLIGFGWFSWFQTRQNEKLSQAVDTASALLEENQQAKRSIEESFAQRESLAMHAIIEFQSLLSLNPRLQSDPQFRSVREKVLKESRSFYESLSKSFDQSEKIDDRSLGRLTDAALALVLLENELGNFSDAIRIADSACQRLRNVKRSSRRLEYHLGRMLTFKGNIEARHGWQQQGQADQEQAVEYLEPLLDSSELGPEDRKNTTYLWSRAASPRALSFAAKGDFQSAKELLQKILVKLKAQESESFEDSLLKIQSYGNLGLVRFFSKDTLGAYEALERAEEASAGCASLNDGNVPFREIVEFEVLRGTLARFKSDLMLTEGKVQPALEIQKQSLRQLTDALQRYPHSTDIQTAYFNCSNRLQGVLAEQGDIAQAKQVAQDWMDLALNIQNVDYSNPKTREFVLLAQHTMGHLSEAASEPQQAQGYYREALTTVAGLLNQSPESEILLSQAIELNVHMIRFEIQQTSMDIAESYLDAAIEHSVKLKSLPEPNPKYVGSIKNQMQVALRILDGSVHREQKQRWERRIQGSGVMP